MTEEFKRLRVLWPDHLGLARGKYVPAALAANGIRHCTGLWALAYDRTMTPETPGSRWNDGLPDFDATYSMDDVRPGWEPGTKVVVADLTDEEGALGISPRGALRKAIADWAALGYQPYVGIEFEAFIFEPDGNGGWKPMDTPGAYVYGTGPAVDPHGLIDATRPTFPSSRLTPSTTRPSSSSLSATPTPCARPTRASSSKSWPVKWPTVSVYV